MEWENIFTNTLDEGLISKIYKEHTKLNSKKSSQLEPEQRLLQRGHRDGQQTYEKMINITNQERCKLEPQ